MKYLTRLFEAHDADDGLKLYVIYYDKRNEPIVYPKYRILSA